MIVSVSLTALTGVALFFLLRFRFLGPWVAIITALFGFSLASTGLAPAINHLISATATAVAHIH